MAFRDTTRPSGKAQVSPVKLGKGMLDMFAGATRGAVRASLGLPGDIETLGRMGYAWATDTETTKNKLPNTEDFDKILPPVTPGQKNPFDELGGYVGGIPVYGATAKVGVKIGKNLNKLLQPSGSTAPSSMSRREFMKKGGAIAATAAIGGVAGKVLSKIDQPAVEAIKTAEKVPAVARSHRFNSLADYTEDLQERARMRLYEENPHWENYPDISEDKIDDLISQRMSKMAADDEKAYSIHKANAKTYGDPDRKLNPLQTKLRDNANKYIEETSFSPQAKAEMKHFQNMWAEPSDMFVGDSWHNYLNPETVADTLKREFNPSLVGAGLGGMIHTASRNVPIPRELAQKMAKRTVDGVVDYKHPDNFFVNPKDGNTYFLGEYGEQLIAVPRKSGEGATDWLRRSLSAQEGRDIPKEEFLKEYLPKLTYDDTATTSSYYRDLSGANKDEIVLGTKGVSEAEVIGKFAHEGSHYGEEKLRRLPFTSNDPMAHPDIKTRTVVGSSIDKKLKKYITSKNKQDYQDGLVRINGLKNEYGQKHFFNKLQKHYKNDPAGFTKVRAEFLELFNAKKNSIQLSNNIYEKIIYEGFPESVFDKKMIDAMDANYKASLDYLLDSGEVHARMAQNLAKHAEEITKENKFLPKHLQKKSPYEGNPYLIEDPAIERIKAKQTKP